MRGTKWLLILASTCVFIYVDDADATCGTDIEVLFMGFRHGARSVTGFLPNDENNSKWPVGIGQLTPQGMRLQYKNGQLVRQRYAPLFDRYDPSTLLARSSGVDRTLMSCSAFLASLVQPKGAQIFQAGLNWQPAAIYTTAILEVHAQKLFATVAGKVMPGVIKSDPATVDILGKASGLNLQNSNELFNLLDDLVTERFAGFNLPYGLDNSLMPKIQALKDKAFVGVFSDSSIVCATAPPILHDLIEKAEKTLRNDTSQFIYIWSMHDANVMAILSALNDYKSESPTFAATLFFEIRSLSNCEDYEIKLIYRKDVDSDYVELDIKKCSKPCTLVQFKTIVQAIEHDCKFNPNSKDYVSCYGDVV